jgi:hypothetical protein
MNDAALNAYSISKEYGNKLAKELHFVNRNVIH